MTSHRGRRRRRRTARRRGLHRVTSPSGILCATSAELVVHRSTDGPETSSLPGQTRGSASLLSGQWASSTTRPTSAVRVPAPLLGETDRDLNPNTSRDTPRAPAHRQQAASGMNENGGGKRLSAAPANTECTAAGGSTEPESVGRLAAAPPARRLRVYVGWVGGEARTARRLRVFPGKPEAPRAF